MALFGKKSLVESVDEIIDLVNNWNIMHCKSSSLSSSKSLSKSKTNKLKLNTKKRAHPSSILDTMIATPAKKSKFTNLGNSNQNCLIDLESEARQKLYDLTLEAIKSIYNLELNDKTQEILFKGLSRPKHGRGEITLPCFVLAKLCKAKPPIIAEEIVGYISKQIEQNTGVLFLSNPFKKVEAANGRINAYLTASYIGQIISLILDKNNCYLSPLPSNGERVMVEYSQPNTHKAFHVGHMRNVALGDCLVRLFTHCGYDTVAANYFGDEGAHVAKCVWLLQKQIDEEKLDLDKIEKTIDNKGEWLGQKYAESVTKLTLSTYTEFPFVGVVVAKILSKEKHPDADDKSKKIPSNWHVVQVEYKDQDGKTIKATVICGGTEYNVGNLVAYVPVGEKYKDKIAEKKDMKGVISNGVIMGAKELGVTLPALPQPKVEETKEENQNENENENENEDDKGGKKGKKGKKKKKQKQGKKKKVTPPKDQRIYLVDQFYPNAKIGDKLTELGKCDESLGDVVELWQKYVTEQQDCLKKIEEGDEKLVNLWMRTRKWSLDEFKKIYNWVGARFDHDFFESECSEESRKLVDEYYTKGIFEKSEGAIGIHLDNKLGFCMLLKSNGSGLYATKDLALAKKKFDQFNIDRSIYVVDATQSHHFKQVFATLNKMGYEQASKCYHLAYAFVRLATGKMATRTGNVILFSDLVNLLSKEINETYLNKLREENKNASNDDEKWSEDELKEAERAISAGSIRYGMLNHDNNKEIIFDLKKWTLSTGNTGPYLMYQFARINSIAKKVEFPANVNVEELDYSIFDNDELAKQILFELSQFQAKIQQICEDKSPSSLCDYVYSICQLFSKWYAQNSIKNTKEPELKAARLLFCQAVAQTIKVGLQILGITPLDRM